MKNYKVIRVKSTLTTIPCTGALGLSGHYLVVGDVEVEGLKCSIIKDWDGVGEGSYIVPKEALLDKNDVELVEMISDRDLDQWLSHPRLVPGFHMTSYQERWLETHE